MDRRKKLLNNAEAVTRRILTSAADNNGAEVWSKVRIADALDIDKSGLDSELFRYALMAHLDFVVVNSDHIPVFAVEFDGPHHESDVRASANDKKKNAICEKLGLPLARVKDEHIFKKARGVDYLTWLSELFFSMDALANAQARGDFPEDEPLDFMSIVSGTHLRGRFPLLISAEARMRLRDYHKKGLLSSSAPLVEQGEDGNGRGASLAVVSTINGEALCSSAEIYLHGFGICPSDAAEEIAVVNLAARVAQFAESRTGAIQTTDLRNMFVRFLKTHQWMGGSSGGGVKLGFSLQFSSREGQDEWRIGALGDEPEVVISVPR
jgi:hypothetical protein